MPCEVAGWSPGQFPTIARYDCVFSLKIQYCASGNRAIPFINPPSLQDYRNQRNYGPAFDVCVFYDVVGTDVVIMAIMSKEKTIQWLKEHGVT
jgi:hypothetical protein